MVQNQSTMLSLATACCGLWKRPGDKWNDELQEALVYTTLSAAMIKAQAEAAD
jgi:hypothetical protein